MNQTHEAIVIVNPSVDLAKLEELFLDLDLDHLETFEPPAAALYEQVHESEDGELLARIIHDDHVQIWMISLQAEDEPRVLALQREILARIDGFTIVDLVAALDPARGAVRKFALRGLAAASTGVFDAAMFDRVTAALEDDDGDLRYTAVVCAARLGWSRFAEPLRRRIAAEQDPEVGERVQSTLDAIEHVHGSAP